MGFPIRGTVNSKWSPCGCFFFEQKTAYEMHASPKIQVVAMIERSDRRASTSAKKKTTRAVSVCAQRKNVPNARNETANIHTNFETGSNRCMPLVPGRYW